MSAARPKSWLRKRRLLKMKSSLHLDVGMRARTTAGHHSGQPRAAIATRASMRAASERQYAALAFYVIFLWYRFLNKKNGRYALTDNSAVFLDQRAPAYIGGTLRFLNSPVTMETFQNLAEIGRRGTTANEDRLTPEHPIWVEFARSMAPMMKMPAELLATMRGADQGPKWKVLSLAAGHGLYEVTLARYNRNAEVWAVDWANVLEIARENAAAAGVVERYHTIAGSASRLNTAAFDLTLVVNFLHHFDPRTCEKLLKKVRTSLKPGGRVVILEFVPNEDRI
jgi:precorrin-6B methylase 2